MSADEPQTHEHQWQDTGFAAVEDCAVDGCRWTRSGGQVYAPTTPDDAQTPDAPGEHGVGSGESHGTEKPAFDQIIDAAEAGQPWTFTKGGKPVAVLIGYDELEQLKARAASFDRVARFAEELNR